MLNEKFPEYNLQQTYIDTGSLAAKLAAEGKDSDADIILELETSYLEKCSDSLAELDSIDFSVYTEDLVPANHKYVPAVRMSGTVIIDPVALEEKNVPIPANYDDLLKPEYKGLISMPNPKSSSTGYIFLLNLINDPCDKEAMKVRLEGDKIVEITKQMSVEDAVGEFIGIMKIKKNVIDDLNSETVGILRDKIFTSYFEGALQRIFDKEKYDICMIETKSRFWGEVDFLEDYQRIERNISQQLLEL